MKRKWTLFLALIILVATWGFAQQKGGTISGRVVETGGEPLPGVSVILTGSVLQGEMTTITNDRGAYRFAEVPVGGDYQLVFTLEGFGRLTNKNVTVALGKETVIATTMQLLTVQEEILVMGKPMIIDPKSSVAQVNITKDTINTLANDRQYQTIMGLMPGAIDGNNPFMLGGGSADNIYNFDGMDNTDPMTKTWSTAMNFDNFEEIQVVTAGAPAEYGRGTGAVINVVTRSGSNAISGTARFTYSKIDWMAKKLGNRYSFSDATHFTNEARPSVNIGFPIFKDKLWAFASYERRNKWIEQTTYADFADTVDKVPGVHEKSYYEGYYLSGKLTFKLNKRNTLFAQYSKDPIEIPNLYGYLGYTYCPPEIDTVRFQGGWNMSGEWNSILGNNTNLILRANIKRNQLNNEPKDLEGIAYYANGVYWGASFTTYFTNRYYNNYGLILNQFLSTGFGTHDFKMGVELLDINLARYSQSYPTNEYITFLSDGVTTNKRYVYTDRPQDKYTKDSFNDLWTIYLQDKWEVARNLTLNLGLRAESGKWIKHDKEVMFNWGFGKMLAPRVGVAYNFKGHKFSGSWGTYYDLMDDTLVNNFQPNIFKASYDEYNGQYFGNADWKYYRTVTFGSASSATIDLDTIKPIKMTEWSLNYEYALSDTIGIGAEYLNRSWKDKYDDYDYDLNGQWHYAGATYPGNSPFKDYKLPDGSQMLPDWGSTFKKYDALIFTLKKNLGNDKYQFMASYTYSHLKGYQGAEGASTFADNSYSDFYAFGYLGNDIRHMFKLNASVFAPWGIVVGANFYYLSGSPYGESGSAVSPNGLTSYTVRLTAPDAFRYPPTSRLDLNFEKRFTIWKDVKVAPFIMFFNILNNQVEVVRGNSVGSIKLKDTSDPLKGYTVTSPSSTYNTYTRWFPPMSFYLGVKIDF